MRRFYIISGGTLNYIDPHLALFSPAFGTVGRKLKKSLVKAIAASGDEDTYIDLILTRAAVGGKKREKEEQALLESAGLSDLKTNADLRTLIDHLVSLPDTKGIVLAAAVCDFKPLDVEPHFGTYFEEPGKNYPRLSSNQKYLLTIVPDEKILGRVRKTRKDIFLVAFKQVTGKTPDEMYLNGLELLKRSSANLVLANDTRARLNMVITPEQARYHETHDRDEALNGLAEMIVARSQLTFTRSTVLPGHAPVSWKDPRVPGSLRTVVNHCIAQGAYKPFGGSTVGHFAVKIGDGEFLTSRRKTDFNKLNEVGLVRIETTGDNRVVAYGFKPSVGGQSQRIIFSEHPQMDCIVHFHCPRKPGSLVPFRSQREYECGSHQCGKNTSIGLASFEDGEILAVMLDKHGPNVVFNRNIDPQKVIRFIEENFDLAGRTDNVGMPAVVHVH
ncbi:MAG: phosphopantothenoylcysteine decarboxylase [bacterium]|nr:phosphopantothenoylcysteine decarboxylase [bacterium]